MPRKVTPEQLAERKRKAAARAGLPVGPGGPGRPFGTTGRPHLKPWMKRIVGSFYTDTMLVKDFLMLGPKERLSFLVALDPKLFGGSPEEVAARVKTVLELIQASVPPPFPFRGKE